MRGEVTSVDGRVIGVGCDTICVHSDLSGAFARIATIRSALASAGLVRRR
jgi:lactam utilization protein B